MPKLNVKGRNRREVGGEEEDLIGTRDNRKFKSQEREQQRNVQENKHLEMGWNMDVVEAEACEVCKRQNVRELYTILLIASTVIGRQWKPLK